MTPLLRAALAGAATGGRSLTGLAALALTAPTRPATQPDRALSSGWVKGLAVLLAALELVIDKLPQAPSRLDPVGLGMRCASAAAAGLIIARRAPAAARPELAPDPAAAESLAPEPPAPSASTTVACLAVAAAAAVGGSWLGARWRGWAAQRTGHDYAGAGLEDAATAGLAWLSTRAG